MKNSKINKNDLSKQGYISGVKTCSYIRNQLNPSNNEFLKIIKSFKSLPDTVKTGDGAGTKYYFKQETIIKEVKKMLGNDAISTADPVENMNTISNSRLSRITNYFINSIEAGPQVLFKHDTIVSVAAALQELKERRKKDKQAQSCCGDS